MRRIVKLGPVVTVLLVLGGQTTDARIRIRGPHHKSPVASGAHEGVCQATDCGSCVAIQYQDLLVGPSVPYNPGYDSIYQVRCGWCHQSQGGSSSSSPLPPPSCVLGTSVKPKHPFTHANFSIGTPVSHRCEGGFDWGETAQCPGAGPTPVPTMVPTTPTPGTIQTCSYHKTCDDCTNAKVHNGGGCGWCKATASCAFGTSNGPFGGLCATWDWTNASCPSVPPTPAPPTIPALPNVTVDANSASWSGHAGNMYHSFSVEEEIGDSILPHQRWQDSPYQGTCCGFPAAAKGLVVSPGQNYNGYWYLQSLNATTGEKVGETQITFITGNGLDNVVIIDEENMIAFTQGYTASMNPITQQPVEVIYAVNLPTEKNNYTQSLAWSYNPTRQDSPNALSYYISSLLFTPGNGVLRDDALAQRRPGVLQFLSHTQNETTIDWNTRWHILNATNGANITDLLLESGVVDQVSNLVAVSAEETLFTGVTQVALLAPFFGAVVWASVAGSGQTTSAGPQMVSRQEQTFLESYYRRDAPGFGYGMRALAINASTATELYTLETGVAVATSGGTFWFVNSSASVDVNRTITEHFVRNGTRNYAAPPLDTAGLNCTNRQGGGIQGNFVVTGDYIFALCSRANDEVHRISDRTFPRVMMWKRSTGMRVTMPISRNDEAKTKTLAYHGGWLYVSTGSSFIGIQIRA